VYVSFDQVDSAVWEFEHQWFEVCGDVFGEVGEDVWLVLADEREDEVLFAVIVRVEGMERKIIQMRLILTTREKIQ
jgi:hypothetical protein